MKSFFRNLSSRFPFFANRPSALERAVRQSPKSRRLRMEPLENRALLAVDAFGASAFLASDVGESWGPAPAPVFSASVLATDAAIVDVSGNDATSAAASFSVQVETPTPVAPPSFDQLMESLGMIEIESLNNESDAASLSFLDAATDEIAATSDATVRRVVFYDSSADDFDASFLNDCEPNLYYIDTATSVAEATGVSSRSGGSGGDEVYSQITPLGSTLLLECDGFPSGGGIAESFFSVVVPYLGSTSRVLRVTPSAGSGAILNQDYIVVANSPYVEGPAEPYAIGGGGYFDVSGGTTFYVVPLNESVIEAKENFSLGLSIVETGSGGGTVAQLEPITASIVDDDTFSLDSITFNDMGLCPDPTVITSTPPNPVAWSDPHWVKNHPELTFPVLYHCVEEQRINCDAVISGEIDPNCTYEIRAVWNYGDEENDKCEAVWTLNANSNFSNEIKELQFSKTFLEIFGESQAYYDPNFTLTWEFKIVGEDTARAIGESVTPLYLTYDVPDTSYLYHTVVHTGCAAASGKNNEADVFNAIWEKFESLNIKKVHLVDGDVVEGETLSYYGKDPICDAEEILENLYFDVSATTRNIPSRARETNIITNKYGTYFLLAGLDGTCVDWQEFALNVLRAQGLSTLGVSVTVEGYDALQVSPAIPGQGGEVPRENIWQGHELIQYGDKIYDPSYGIDYGPSETAAQTFISRALISVGYESQVVSDEDADLFYDGKHKLCEPIKLRTDIQVDDLCFTIIG